jgi:hypothetical protein
MSSPRSSASVSATTLSEAADILSREIPWETYTTAQLLSPQDLQLIRRFDKKSVEEKSFLLAEVITFTLVKMYAREWADRARQRILAGLFGLLGSSLIHICLPLVVLLAGGSCLRKNIFDRYPKYHKG